MLSIASSAPHRAGAVGVAVTVTDPRSLGAVRLFDAAGLPMISGSDLSHIADFAQASTPDVGAKSASLAFAIPDSNGSELWPVSDPTPATASPTTSLGASVSAPDQPAATLSPTEANLAAFLTSAKVTTAAKVQVRVLAGGPGGVDPSRYWDTMLDVDVTAGTWSQIAASPADTDPATSTVTASDAAAPEASPVDPAARTSALSQGHSTAVAVTIAALEVSQISGQAPLLGSVVVAADGRHPAGTVELLDNDAVSSSAEYDPATGSVTATAQNVDSATRHRYRLQFSPADPAAYAPASSPELLISSVGKTFKKIDTTLTVVVAPPVGNTAFGSAQLSAYVSPAGLKGTVQFSDSLGGSLGSVTLHDGVAKLLTNALGVGKHVVSGKFTPKKDSCSTSATARSEQFELTAAATTASGTDPQAATVTVAAGRLTITTPYTPDHPFSLGNLVLTNSGAKLFASAHFGSAKTASLKGISITDTRPGDQPWTASVGSTSFINGVNAISAENLGFINIHEIPGAGSGGLGSKSKPVKIHDLPAATQVQLLNLLGNQGLAGAPKEFATALHGSGSVYLYGDLVLSAPTTTPVGTYTATLTFTVG